MDLVLAAVERSLATEAGMGSLVEHPVRQEVPDLVQQYFAELDQSLVRVVDLRYFLLVDKADFVAAAVVVQVAAE